MSHFTFLQPEWPDLHTASLQAEASVRTDPRTACFHARRALELLVRWLYTHDARLRLPYDEQLSALVHAPAFREAVDAPLFAKARVIITLGNRAVHNRPVSSEDGVVAVRELFHLGYWLAHTYARGAKPAAGLTFRPEALPAGAAGPKQSAEQLQRLEAQVRERDAKLAELLSEKAGLDAALAKAREEISAARKANAAQPDTHNYSEEQTRDTFIDLLLKEAGWPLAQARDREFEVQGMPNTQGKGYVDYVLWGDDGMPLAVIEAKRTKRDPRVGQRQAELYADCLEKQFSRRPVIYYTNGYEHWLWDDSLYPPRAVQGFHKKAELELMIQRRSSRKPLGAAPINEAIVERYYQTRAIRRIGEAFEQDRDRKTLVVMATGAGKTRTVIALCDLLMRCNWVKRVLFLADRVALVNQAVNAFKKHLPEASPVNLVTEKEAEGRVYVSTYPTMMGLINDSKDDQRRFGIGHFDLIVIDEAHRSVYQKYKAIFDYFDSLLVGLTATPRDEIDRDTYGLFDLEKGVPTDTYDLKDAVTDKFLVPAKPVSVPLKFLRQGLRYDELSEEEKEQWDAKEWDEDGTVPDVVEAEAVNKWLFNIDTVDKVLAHLMTHGLRVAGGDRLGKTIIFARNQQHADFIQERFDKNYPKLAGKFARVITFKTEYAQSLIDDFSVKEKMPHIAVSVDMLDTGIDVPEVVNLVFFKLVRSKTKFWQMVGRGTRLCPDLFSPGQDKAFFYVFDYCQNLEYFSANPETIEAPVPASLGKRLFTTRLELAEALGADPGGEVRENPASKEQIRHELFAILQREVAAMNIENFVVRPKRRFVEKYAVAEAWSDMSKVDYEELTREVAGLPAELEPEDEEAKRFDLLMLNLQLALLRTEPRFKKLCEQVRTLAALLEEKATIPLVHSQIILIQEVQTDEWWQDVTLTMLETARRKLRLLIKLIEKKQRKPIYTDFEDELGVTGGVDLPVFAGSDDFDRFRAKASAYLRQHESHLTIQKLRLNVALTKTDIQELEKILLASGTGSPADVAKAKKESRNLGLFVRSLVGLDREAAKKSLAGFLTGRSFGANQIEFINMVIDHLTAQGVMDPARLYESPFTDLSPKGPEGLFDANQVSELVSLLNEVTQRASG